MAPATRGGPDKRLKEELYDPQTYNPYHGLSDDDDGSSIYSEGHNPRRTRVQFKLQRRQREQLHSTHTSTAYTQKNVSKKVSLPPPIIIENTRIQTLIEHLRPLNIAAEKFKYKIARKGISIYTADLDTYNAICSQIKTVKVPGYTHTPKEERFTRFCLYGLYPMDTELLLPELKKHLIEPDKIRKMYENPNYPDEAIYMLYFKKKQNMTIEKLDQITGLFSLTTKFKSYRSKMANFTQCSNCQSLGHGTQNCFKAAVCVRCAEFHKSTECPLIAKDMDGIEVTTTENGVVVAEDKNKPKVKPKIAEEQLKCALCGQKGHSAAWSKCKVKLDYQDNLKFIRNHQAPRRRKIRQNFVPKSDFFPDTLKPSNIHPLQTSYHIYKQAPTGTPQSNAWHQRSQNSQLLSVDECLNLIDYFTNELLKCTTVAEQVNAIARLSLHVVQKTNSRFNQP